MEDKSVTDRINELSREEHELFEKESRGEAINRDRERLKHLEVMLDQCWDLLHQRRARRSAGLDPDEAKVRDERSVEGYVG
jgi:site-specific recombinase